MNETTLINTRGHYGRTLMNAAVAEGRFVYIGRPSKWGNPFRVNRNGDHGPAVERYREYILKQPELLAALPELEGKVLGCWCKPAACHGDVLLELLNGVALHNVTT